MTNMNIGMISVWIDEANARESINDEWIPRAKQSALKRKGSDFLFFSPCSHGSSLFEDLSLSLSEMFVHLALH